MVVTNINGHVYVARQSLDAEITILKQEISKINLDSRSLSEIAPDTIASLPENLTGLMLRDIARSSPAIAFGQAPSVDG